MSEELRAAANEALRIICLPNIVDNIERWYGISPLASKLANNWLASNPADDREPVTREWLATIPRPDPNGWPLGENPYHYFDLQFGETWRPHGFAPSGKCWLWICVDSESPPVHTIEVLDRGHARRLIAELTRK